MVTPVTSSGKIGIKVYNGQAPLKEPRAMPFSLNFAQAINGQLAFDLAESQDRDKIEWVQSVYVDNSANSNSFSLTFAGTFQTLTWPANTQGYLACLCPNEPHIVASTSGSPIINMQFLTFPVANIIWSTASSGGGGGFLGTVALAGTTGSDHSANKPSLSANLLGTAAVNATRNSIEVQNQSADQIQVVRDDGAGGNISIILLAAGSGANAQGGDWASQTFKGRVRVFGPSAGDQMAMFED